MYAKVDKYYLAAFDTDMNYVKNLISKVFPPSFKNDNWVNETLLVDYNDSGSATNQTFKKSTINNITYSFENEFI